MHGARLCGESLVDLEQVEVGVLGLLGLADQAVAGADRASLSALMVGRSIAPSKRTPQVPGAPMLVLDRVSVAAPAGQVGVQEASLVVHAGEVVAIVGANGAGKSTLLSCIAGLVRPSAGQIRFRGEDILRRPAHRLPGDGLALVPEGGRLFPFLSVRENLQLGAYAPGARPGLVARMAEVMAIFPVLQERGDQMAGKLSGGQKQMLAVSRAIVEPRELLIVDEPSKGLAPAIINNMIDAFAELKAQGVTILLVEQNANRALQLADRGYVMESGLISMFGDAKVMLNDPKVRAAYLGE